MRFFFNPFLNGERGRRRERDYEGKERDVWWRATFRLLGVHYLELRTQCTQPAVHSSNNGAGQLARHT